MANNPPRGMVNGWGESPRSNPVRTPEWSLDQVGCWYGSDHGRQDRRQAIQGCDEGDVVTPTGGGSYAAST